MSSNYSDFCSCNSLEVRCTVATVRLYQVLLSCDEMVQLSGVQSIAEVLAHCAGYGEVLLQADIAGTVSVPSVNGLKLHVRVLL